MLNCRNSLLCVVVSGVIEEVLLEVVFVVTVVVFIVIEGVAVLLEDVSVELEAVSVLIINTSEVVSVEIVEEVDTFFVYMGVLLEEEEEDVFIRFVVLDVLDTFRIVPLLENNTVELRVGGNVVSGLGELDVIFVLFEEVGKEVDWVVGFKVVLDVVVDLFPGIELEPSWVEPKPPGVEPEPPVVEPEPPVVEPEPPEDEPEFEPDPELVPVPEPKDQMNENKILINRKFSKSSIH